MKSNWGPVLGRSIGKILGLFGAMFIAVPATYAQNDSSARPMEEVVVTGIRASIENAINTKRMSDQIVDAISSEDIGKLPDDNIGEALQRVTGVSLTREAGEGKEISIRGLGAGLSQVTVNGQKMASTEGNRSFNYSVLDASLVSALEVWKSPMASQDEGSVGGSVNIVTRGPLDTKRTRIVVSAGGQYEGLPETWGGKYNASFATQNDAGTLGFALSANYSDRETRSDQIVVPGWEIIDAMHSDWTSRGWDQLAAANGLSTLIYPLDVSSRVRTYDRSRGGFNPTFQWRPNDKIDFRIEGLYSKLDDFDTNQSLQIRIRDLVRGGGRDVNDYVWEFDNNNVSFFDTAGASIANGWRGFRNIATLRENDWTTVGLQTSLDWILDDRQDISFQLGHNEGDGELITYPVAQFQESTGFSADFRDNPRFPDAAIEGGFSDADLEFRNLTINDRYDDERSSFAQVDYSNAVSTGHISAVKVGVKYHEAALSRWQVRHDTGGGVSGTLDEFALLCGGTPCVAPNLSYEGDTAAPFNGAFTQVDLVALGMAVPKDTRDSSVAFDESWNIEEETIALYVQLDLDGNMFGLPYRGNVGLRYYDTDLLSSGWLQADGSESGAVDRSYSELLPSLNLAFTLREDVLLRFGASKVMARPDQEDLSFGGNFNLVDEEARVGNPNLDPFRATALDLGIEWYFAPAGLLSGAVFYKDVDSFISNGVIEGGIVVETPTGPITFDATGPVNGDGAKIKGFEIGYQHAFDFLPYPWNGFGTQLNYTYTDSTVNIPYTEGGSTFDMPLEGLSKSSYNTVIYYERERFSVRLAYNYRDKFLSNRSNTQGNPVFTDDYAQLDASVSWNITDAIALSANAINLNDEARYQYFLTPDRMLAHRASGRRFAVGLRARF